jgi:hypothetical protein
MARPEPRLRRAGRVTEVALGDVADSRAQRATRPRDRPGTGGGGRSGRTSSSSATDSAGPRRYWVLRWCRYTRVRDRCSASFGKLSVGRATDLRTRSIESKTADAKSSWCGRVTFTSCAARSQHRRACLRSVTGPSVTIQSG